MLCLPCTRHWFPGSRSARIHVLHGTALLCTQSVGVWLLPTVWQTLCCIAVALSPATWACSRLSACSCESCLLYRAIALSSEIEAALASGAAAIMTWEVLPVLVDPDQSFDFTWDSDAGQVIQALTSFATCLVSYTSVLVTALLKVSKCLAYTDGGAPNDAHHMLQELFLLLTCNAHADKAMSL